MSLFKKYKGPDHRMGGVDRRYGGRWATHIWGIILLIVFSMGLGVGLSLRAGTALADSQVASLSERDSIRSQIILDSVGVLLARPVLEVITNTVVRDVLVHDTVQVIDTVLVEVASAPQIIRVSDTIQVLIIDTVFAPPTIITIPPVQYGFFDSRHFVPNAGNIAYLIVGAALGSIVSSDASACILVSTTGTLERNCEPKQ